MKTKTLVKILALLGFGSCISACEYGTPSPMYGMPSRDWVDMTGIVTDEAGTPIKGIKVHSSNIRLDIGSDILTADNGHYTIGGYLYNSENTVLLEFDDIDGEENGGDFASTAISVVTTAKIVPTVAMALKEPINISMYGIPSVPFREMENSNE